MVLSGLLAECRTRNSLLFWFGCLNWGLLLLAMMMYAVDSTLINGINAWIKPMKFAISIAIYAWTFGWLLHYSSNERANRLIAYGLVLSMTMEVVLIYMQAFRGTTSHFNIHTAFDGIVFAVMGWFIGLNSLVNLYTLIVFFSSRISIKGSSLWVWRAGLALFFLGGISGGWMVAQLAHTVGAVDGGPGIPFLNWSTVAGDIRAAHFATLHGLQILPIVSYLLTTAFKENSVKWSVAFIVIYAGVCVYLHALGYLGLPVIGN